MSDVIARELARLLAEHGLSLLRDVGRCETLLARACGKYKQQVFLSVLALKSGAVPSLLSSNSSRSLDSTIRTLAKKLHRDFAIVEESALWAVGMWADALGLRNLAQQGINANGNNGSEKSPSRLPPPQQDESHDVSSDSECTPSDEAYTDENEIASSTEESDSGQKIECPECSILNGYPKGGGTVQCAHCEYWFTVWADGKIIDPVEMACPHCSDYLEKLPGWKVKCPKCGLTGAIGAQRQLMNHTPVARCCWCRKRYLIKPDTTLCPRCGKPVGPHELIPTWRTDRESNLDGSDREVGSNTESNATSDHP